VALGVGQHVAARSYPLIPVTTTRSLRLPLRRLTHVALSTAVLLSACRSHAGLRSFDVAVAPGVNAHSPVEVEFVVVRDEKLMQILLELSARDWFARRAQLKSDYPKELQSVSWEFVPGQRVEAQELPLEQRAGEATLIFANYSTPGLHRQRVDQFRRITLLLGASDFSIEERKR
jgi:type VI secretion system protein